MNESQGPLPFDVRVGDVFATADYSIISKIVRFVTRGSVSHVAIVIATKPEIMMLEARPVGFYGSIVPTLLSERIVEQNQNGGRAWILRLSDENHDKISQGALIESIGRQTGRPYDAWQALWSPVKWLPSWLRKARCDASLFCSESVCKTLSDCGVLPDNFDFSYQTPDDVMKLPIYKDYRQVCGSERQLAGFSQEKGMTK